MSPPNPPNECDTAPVCDEEWLLRRFPSEPGMFDVTSMTPRLNIFIPSMQDRDGLSLNRENNGNGVFLTAAELLMCATSPKVRETGGVIAVFVHQVRKDGMTVNPDPADTPGHVLIPEMNRLEYDRKEPDGTQPGKKKIKELADKLVRSAIIRIQPRQSPPSARVP